MDRPVSRDSELTQLSDAAVEAARIGGAVLQEWIGRFSVREKSRSNLVTEADEASQAAIVSYLRNQFPEHGFLGEENLNDRTDTGSQSPGFWIIDPLDGTSNYVHQFPYYAVSIGFFAAGRIQVGVVFDPSRNEMFNAAAGRGATLNAQPIRTSGETDPARALAVASLPTAVTPDDAAIRRFVQALSHLQAVQRTGSAALNLAYVAAGRIDGFWSTSLHPWDVAAGVLLVQEAGGVVTGLAGDPVDIFVPDLLAASSHSLQGKLSQVLA